MAVEPVRGVRPLVLKWARETANLSVENVASRLNKPVDVIQAWETGGEAPTYSQLERLAYEIYKRPLALFFLPAPPDEPRPQAEFRGLPTGDLIRLHRDTVLLIRKARAFQFALQELFGSQSPVKKPIWEEVKLSTIQPIAAQASAVRDALAITIAEQTEWSNPDFALKMWRRRIEARGVFVFKHTFTQSELSGFCLVDEAFPLVMINNSTSKTRQIFSLLHELAHVLFQQTSISAFEFDRVNALPPSERAVESFCNKIAAEILVPSADFQTQIQQWAVSEDTLTDDQFAVLASRYSVSREVILRRFLDANIVDREFYNTRVEAWSAAADGKKSGGGNYYATLGAYLSETFVNEVIARYSRRQITKTEAAELIGVAPKNFDRLQDQVLQGSAA